MTERQLVSAWHVTTDPLTLRRMGKLGEECGELLEVLGKMVAWGRSSMHYPAHILQLEHEIADVLAQCACVTDEFFEPSWIESNVERKVAMLGPLCGWEELLVAVAQLSCVASRIVIQGIDEIDPSTQLPNRTRLGKAIVDTIAHYHKVMDHPVRLNREAIEKRVATKMAAMHEWEELLLDEESETTRAIEPDAPLIEWLFDGLLCGEGATDDHEIARKVFRDAGISEPTIERLMLRIVARGRVMQKLFDAICDIRVEAKRLSNDTTLSEEERGRWKAMQERLKLALNGGYGTLQWKLGESMVQTPATEAEPVFVIHHVGMSYGEGPGKTTVLVGNTTNLAALTSGAKLYR